MSLYDRGYMHGNNDSSQTNSSGVIWGLIAVNVLFFLLARPNGELYQNMVLWNLPEMFRPWQLITAGFMHSGFTHILFNMWGLHLFGSLVLPHVGAHRFFWLYMAGVLSGNVLFLLTSWGGRGVLLGASGAVCAVMMAAATLEPDRKFVMIFMPFTPLKTSTLVVCYTVLEVLLQVTGAQGGVSHLAHLCGFAAGYIAVKIWFKNTLVWDPLRRRKQPSAPRQEYSFKMPDPAKNTKSVSPAELDALLEKISREGINSLSEYELSRLRQAREEMRGK